mmetsp:Transcript_21428/g.59357  ORF Transcript_21428/g.59357 Transcript_21428/m.59357 type:complete len:80 (-) Transcript_21428:462-701(-)
MSMQTESIQARGSDLDGWIGLSGLGAAAAERLYLTNLCVAAAAVAAAAGAVTKGHLHRRGERGVINVRETCNLLCCPVQ